MRDLNGKVAVVTGGARGIGKALSAKLAAEGAHVVVSDLDGDEAGRTAREITSAHAGSRVVAVAADVAKYDEVARLAEATLREFGKVHVVMNNAGVAGRAAPAWELSEKDWNDILGPNLWGVIHGIRAFVPILLAQKEWGHVVNTASMAGLVSLPGLASYHVTKHSVVTLSEVLHHDLAMAGAEVGVSVLCPGFVKTDIARAAARRRQAEGAPAEDEEKPMSKLFTQLVDGGIGAEKVADVTVQAVREGRFYVFTHPEMKGAIKLRTDEILGEKQPTFRLA